MEERSPSFFQITKPKIGRRKKARIQQDQSEKTPYRNRLRGNASRIEAAGPELGLPVPLSRKRRAKSKVKVILSPYLGIEVSAISTLLDQSKMGLSTTCLGLYNSLTSWNIPKPEQIDDGEMYVGKVIRSFVDVFDNNGFPLHEFNFEAAGFLGFAGTPKMKGILRTPYNPDEKAMNTTLNRSVRFEPILKCLKCNIATDSETSFIEHLEEKHFRPSKNLHKLSRQKDIEFHNSLEEGSKNEEATKPKPTQDSVIKSWSSELNERETLKHMDVKGSQCFEKALVVKHGSAEEICNESIYEDAVYDLAPEKCHSVMQPTTPTLPYPSSSLKKSFKHPREICPVCHLDFSKSYIKSHMDQKHGLSVENYQRDSRKSKNLTNISLIPNEVELLNSRTVNATMSFDNIFCSTQISRSRSEPGEKKRYKLPRTKCAICGVDYTIQYMKTHMQYHIANNDVPGYGIPGDQIPILPEPIGYPCVPENHSSIVPIGYPKSILSTQSDQFRQPVPVFADASVQSDVFEEMQDRELQNSFVSKCKNHDICKPTKPQNPTPKPGCKLSKENRPPTPAPRFGSRDSQSNTEGRTMKPFAVYGRTSFNVHSAARRTPCLASRPCTTPLSQQNGRSSVLWSAESKNTADDSIATANKHSDIFEESQNGDGYNYPGNTSVYETPNLPAGRHSACRRVFY